MAQDQLILLLVGLNLLQLFLLVFTMLGLAGVLAQVRVQLADITALLVVLRGKL